MHTYAKNVEKGVFHPAISKFYKWIRMLTFNTTSFRLNFHKFGLNLKTGECLQIESNRVEQKKVKIFN